MALTQISTQGIKDGTITGTDIATNLDLVDNQKLRFGASQDLQIYHDGSHSRISEVGTGKLILETDGSEIQLNKGTTENMIKCFTDGAVELYHDGSKKVETISAGAKIFNTASSGGTRLEIQGQEGQPAILQLNADDGDDNADYSQIYHGTDGSVLFRNFTSGSWETNIKTIGNGAVELYFDNSKKFATHSNGSTVFGDFFIDNQTNSGKDLFFDESGNILKHFDNVKSVFGDGNDLQIFHDGTRSYIDSKSTQLRIETDALRLRSDSGETYLEADANGAVQLYYDNTLRFSTNNFDNSGNRFYGALSGGDSVPIYLGNSNDLTLLHDGTDCRIRYNHTVGELKFQLNNNNTVASFNTNGHFVPGSNNTYDLGTSSLRYRSIFASNALDMVDNAKVQLGNSDDLQIYHDGTDSYLQNTTGTLRINNDGTDLVISTDNNIHIRTNGTEEAVKAIANGAVELYYDNSKKLETTSYGSKVTGRLAATTSFTGSDNVKLILGDSDDLQIYHDGTNSIIEHDTVGSDLIIQTTGSADDVFIKCSDDFIVNVVNGTENAIIARNDGEVELYYDASKKFETTSAGFALKEGNTTRMSFTYSNSLNFITANAGNEIKVSSGNGDANGIEFWDYTGVNKRCQIDGHGIKFNADTAAANALDDYEEGTFQVSVTNGVTNVTYESNGRNGSYTKIGRYVFFTLRIHMANSTGNGTIIKITGLPFTAKSFSHDNNVAGGADPFYQDGFYNANDFSGIVVDGDTTINLVKRNNGTALTGNDVNRGREFRMTGTYMT